MRCICVGVPLERQKLMIAGQSITDEMWNETALKKIKPVSTVMMTRERERERVPILLLFYSYRTVCSC